METIKTSKNRKKIIIISTIVVAILLVLVLVVAPFTATALIYNDVFGVRYEESDKPIHQTLEEYPNVVATPMEFMSGKNTLRGDYYVKKDLTTRPKALLIFCHGITNGARDYLNYIDYFASKNFLVLAYNNTATFTSDGKSAKGLPESMVNLKDCLEYIEKTEALNNYKILLMGHSWGAYAVNAVLNNAEYPRIKAVVSLSAFNSGGDMLVEYGRKKLGGLVDYFKPFMNLYEQMLYGKYAKYTAIGGLNKSGIPSMAFHSTDDNVVTFESSLVKHSLESTNSKAKFITYENRRHNVALSDASHKYDKSIRDQVDALDKLSPDFAAKRKEIFDNVDKKRFYELDTPLLDQILYFFDTALGYNI